MNIGLPNVTVNRIACDFETFYFNDDDLIINNPNRKNKSNYIDKNDSVVAFKTDRFLAEILNGHRKLNRTVLLQWLLFCEVDLYNIDEYLINADFLPVIGNEDNEPLSNLIVFVYKMKDKYGERTSDVLKDVYTRLEYINTDDDFRFPLYSSPLERS